MRCAFFCMWMIGLSLIAGAAFGDSTYRVIEVEKGGGIAGTTKLVGDYPPSRMSNVTRDHEACGQYHPMENFIVDPQTRGLKNVVITIKDIAAGKGYKELPDPVISQEQCVYIPHVQVFKPQTKLTIRNNDGVLHNIHAYTAEQTLFNIAQPSYVKKWPVRDLDADAVINVQCDVHEWMNAYLFPVEHPYFAISNKAGAFEIDQVPPGSYTIQAWHEVLGTMEKTVVITAGAAAVIAFDMKLDQEDKSTQPEPE